MFPSHCASHELHAVTAFQAPWWSPCRLPECWNSFSYFLLLTISVKGWQLPASLVTVFHVTIILWLWWLTTSWQEANGMWEMTSKATPYRRVILWWLFHSTPFPLLSLTELTWNSLLLFWALKITQLGDWIVLDYETAFRDLKSVSSQSLWKN